jgi:putative ABC transport system permease protein
VMLMLAGGMLGLGLAWLFTRGLEASGLPIPMALPPHAFITGAAWMIAAGLLAGLFPALSAMRLRIVDALARG